jgi:preprotein translocase subunit SecD
VGLDINDNTYSLKSLWEEQASPNDDSKCDKITIHLSRKDSKHNENIVSAIIYVSTGRIQIQGKYLLEWGDSEFIALLNIVNAIRDGEISDEIQESSVNDLGKFIDLISTPKTLEIQENIEIENDGANEPTFTENEETNMNSPEPRDKSFIAVKNTVANVESEFILFKQEMYKSFAAVQATLKEKDQKIELLNKRINALEAINDLLNKQQNIKKQEEFENKLNKIEQHLLAKSSSLPDQKVESDEAQEHASHPNSPNNTTSFQESNTPETKMPDDKFIFTPNIPTSNNFSSLTDEHEDTIPCTNPDTTPLEHKNYNPQKTPSAEKKIISTETVILCDSNGKHLDMNLLCPGTTTSYIRCPTTAEAIKILEQHTFTNPKTIIIHCGTNDIELTAQCHLFHSGLFEHIPNKAVSDNIE